MTQASGARHPPAASANVLYFASAFSHFSASQVLVTQAHELGLASETACKAPRDTLRVGSTEAGLLAAQCRPEGALWGTLGIQRLGFLASLRDFDPVIGFLGTRCPDL